MLEGDGRLWQSPVARSRPVPIGSPPIGVSLQPAIPRRVAPQQSSLPLHQSPIIVAQSRSDEVIKYATHLTAGMQVLVTLLVPVAMACHLYFPRRVPFLPSPYRS